MDNNVKWHGKAVLENAAKKIKENGFEVFVFDSKTEAADKILQLISIDETVGFGGSMTVAEMELVEKLRNRGQKNVLQHAPGMPREQSLEIRKKALTADVYISSPNAVTLDGTLLFCDGGGNRVAAMIYGPKRVIAVAGANKITTNEQTGWDRINNFASPTNAKRLNLQTPCAITGVCTDCDSPQRICNIGVTIWKKPRLTDYCVILVNEELGY